MADATLNPPKTRSVEEVIDEGGVTLNLNPEEAQFLRDIVHKIGGDPRDSRRKHAVSITNALDDVGISPNEGNLFSGDIAVNRSSIYFLTEPQIERQIKGEIVYI